MKNRIKTNFESGENIFFTSDTHFWHRNIIRSCNRPFETVEEMNAALIENWNKVVPKDGIVFHLGDFGFCGSKHFKEIMDTLNGNIYLVTGNHDFKMLTDGIAKRFVYTNLEYNIQIEHQKIVLNHKPLLCYQGTYNKDKRYTWQLFGHVHSGPRSKSGLDLKRLKMLWPMQYDVGVDNNEYTPVSFYQVKDIIDKQIAKFFE